ncbi:MAG: DUF1289 domain-containing protein [Pseudomonadota bacterium]|nr:DUF1289 domain-containing protein [Pseudomonadota bacterium]
MSQAAPVSPCINVCALDSYGICVGCYRTMAEIAGWGQMNPAEQWAVLNRAAGRRPDAAGERAP